MKKIVIIITGITLIITSFIAVDSRYGLAEVQQYMMSQQSIHKLEHAEDVLQKRVFDLESRYGANPTHEQKLDIKKAEIELEKKQREINKALGIKE